MRGRELDFPTLGAMTRGFQSQLHLGTRTIPKGKSCNTVLIHALDELLSSTFEAMSKECLLQDGEYEKKLSACIESTTLQWYPDPVLFPCPKEP